MVASYMVACHTKIASRPQVSDDNLQAWDQEIAAPHTHTHTLLAAGKGSPLQCRVRGYAEGTARQRLRAAAFKHEAGLFSPIRVRAAKQLPALLANSRSVVCPGQVCL